MLRWFLAAGFLIMAMLGGTAMLTVAGCSISGVRVESANGDSTGVSGGRGEATIAGVKVEVEGLRETQSGINSGVKITENADGATEVDTRHVRLGEVKLTFVRIDDGPLWVSIEGREYGEVKEGDEIRIDDQRNVTINGQARKPIQDDDSSEPSEGEEGENSDDSGEG